MLPFYEKTTKSFSVLIKVNSAPQDLTEDQVLCIFKDSKSDTDEAAVITVVGDVSEKGSQGIASFVIPKEDTAVPPGEYVWEIKWIHGDAEDIVASSSVKIKERVFD